MRSREPPAGQRNHRVREVRHNRLGKQRGTDDRQAGENRKRQWRTRRDGQCWSTSPVKCPVQGAGPSERQERNGRAGDDLVRAHA